MDEDYNDYDGEIETFKPPGHVQFTGELDIDQKYISSSDDLDPNGTDDQSDAQIKIDMISHYNDYIYSAQRDKSEHEGSETVQTQPGYLNETFSSRAPDYCAQMEVERVNNSFRSGSHWTIKKLPTHFEPGSVRTERKAHAMTNLLGMIAVRDTATRKCFLITKKYHRLF
jgi:hypothetical protein